MKDKGKLYIIHWKSKVTGFSGQGTSPMSAATADACIRRLNGNAPLLTHWKVEYKGE